MIDIIIFMIIPIINGGVVLFFIFRGSFRFFSDQPRHIRNVKI